MISLQTSFVPPDLKAAVAEARRRQVVEKGVFDAMDFENKQKAFTVAGTLNNRLVSEIQGKVNSAIENGMSYRDFTKSLDPETLKNITAPQVVYDNAVNFSYQKGRFDAQQRIKSLKPFLEYITMRDDRVRPNHAILQGVVAPQDSEFWKANYPPNGHRCRCIAQARSEGDVARRGLTVETSKEEIDARLIQKQKEAGVQKIAVPGADKGWTGAPTPGLTTLDSWTEKFKRIDPKFKVPVFDKKLPKLIQDGKTVTPKTFKNVVKAKEAVKKIPDGQFVPATTVEESFERLSKFTISGSAKQLQLPGSQMGTLPSGQRKFFGISTTGQEDLQGMNVLLEQLEDEFKEFGFLHTLIDTAAQSKDDSLAWISGRSLHIKPSTMKNVIGKPTTPFEYKGEKSAQSWSQLSKLQRTLERAVAKNELPDEYLSQFIFLKNKPGTESAKEAIPKFLESLPNQYKTEKLLKTASEYQKTIDLFYNCDKWSMSSSKIFEGRRLKGTSVHESGHFIARGYESKVSKSYLTVENEFVFRLKKEGIEHEDFLSVSWYAWKGSRNTPGKYGVELFAEMNALRKSGTTIENPTVKKIMTVFESIIKDIKAGTL